VSTVKKSMTVYVLMYVVDTNFGSIRLYNPLSRACACYQSLIPVPSMPHGVGEYATSITMENVPVSSGHTARPARPGFTRGASPNLSHTRRYRDCIARAAWIVPILWLLSVVLPCPAMEILSQYQVSSANSACVTGSCATAQNYTHVEIQFTSADGQLGASNLREAVLNLSLVTAAGEPANCQGVIQYSDPIEIWRLYLVGYIPEEVYTTLAVTDITTVPIPVALSGLDLQVISSMSNDTLASVLETVTTTATSSMQTLSTHYKRMQRKIKSMKRGLNGMQDELHMLAAATTPAPTAAAQPTFTFNLGSTNSVIVSYNSGASGPGSISAILNAWANTGQNSTSIFQQFPKINAAINQTMLWMMGNLSALNDSESTMATTIKNFNSWTTSQNATLAAAEGNNTQTYLNIQNYQSDESALFTDAFGNIETLITLLPCATGCNDTEYENLANWIAVLNSTLTGMQNDFNQEIQSANTLLTAIRTLDLLVLDTRMNGQVSRTMPAQLYAIQESLIAAGLNTFIEAGSIIQATSPGGNIDDRDLLPYTDTVSDPRPMYTLFEWLSLYSTEINPALNVSDPEVPSEAYAASLNCPTGTTNPMCLYMDLFPDGQTATFLHLRRMSFRCSYDSLLAYKQSWTTVQDLMNLIGPSGCTPGVDCTCWVDVVRERCQMTSTSGAPDPMTSTTTWFEDPTLSPTSIQTIQEYCVDNTFNWYLPVSTYTESPYSVDVPLYVPVTTDTSLLVSDASASSDYSYMPVAERFTTMDAINTELALICAHTATSKLVPVSADSMGVAPSLSGVLMDFDITTFPSEIDALDPPGGQVTWVRYADLWTMPVSGIFPRYYVPTDTSMCATSPIAMQAQSTTISNSTGLVTDTLPNSFWEHAQLVVQSSIANLSDSINVLLYGATPEDVTWELLPSNLMGEWRSPDQAVAEGTSVAPSTPAPLMGDRTRVWMTATSENTIPLYYATLSATVQPIEMNIIGCDNGATVDSTVIEAVPYVQYSPETSMGNEMLFAGWLDQFGRDPTCGFPTLDTATDTGVAIDGYTGWVYDVPSSAMSGIFEEAARRHGVDYILDYSASGWQNPECAAIEVANVDYPLPVMSMGAWKLENSVSGAYNPLYASDSASNYQRGVEAAPADAGGGCVCGAQIGDAVGQPLTENTMCQLLRTRRLIDSDTVAGLLAAGSTMFNSTTSAATYLTAVEATNYSTSVLQSGNCQQYQQDTTAVLDARNWMATQPRQWSTIAAWDFPGNGVSITAQMEDVCPSPAQQFVTSNSYGQMTLTVLNSLSIEVYLQLSASCVPANGSASTSATQMVTLGAGQTIQWPIAACNGTVQAIVEAQEPSGNFATCFNWQGAASSGTSSLLGTSAGTGGLDLAQSGNTAVLYAISNVSDTVSVSTAVAQSLAIQAAQSVVSVLQQVQNAIGDYEADPAALASLSSLLAGSSNEIGTAISLLRTMMAQQLTINSQYSATFFNISATEQNILDTLAEREQLRNIWLTAYQGVLTNVTSAMASYQQNVTNAMSDMATIYQQTVTLMAKADTVVPRLSTVPTPINPINYGPLIGPSWAGMSAFGDWFAEVFGDVYGVAADVVNTVIAVAEAGFEAASMLAEIMEWIIEYGAIVLPILLLLCLCCMCAPCIEGGASIKHAVD
jgi:hypothetical protein